MASMTSTVIGNHDLVICVNVKNYAGKPVDALFVIQVKNQYGVTEMVALQDATVAAKGEIMVGVKWVPKVPGDHAIDVFAIDDLDSPLILSEAKSLLEKIYQSAIYMTVPDFAYMVNTGHVAFREYFPVATVVVGYNNTVIWKNDEIRQHKVRATTTATRILPKRPGAPGLWKVGSLLASSSPSPARTTIA